MKLKVAVFVLLCIVLFANGCANRTGSGSTDKYVKESVPMTTYGREWILEHDSFARRMTEDDFNWFYFYADYALKGEEVSAYFHKPEEYRADNGSFINPSTNAMNPEWECNALVKAEEVADAVIPKEIMDEMSTMELLKTAVVEKAIVVQPFMGMYYEPYYINGLSRSSTYREFLSRDDYAQTLYEFYMSIDPEEYIGNDFRENRDDMQLYSKTFIKMCGIQFIEVTMATDEFYDSLTDVGRKNIVKKSREIDKYLADNAHCDIYQVMWSAYSESGYSAFESVVSEYDVTPKWKMYLEK